jgi:glycosyltransferase involved in cell wall biosynthesis
MASGTTVVASAIDGYQNVATDGVDALLCIPGDAESLRVALHHALHDDALRARLTDSGRRRADEFSMVSLADSYVTAYRRAIDGESTAPVKRSYSSRVLRVVRACAALLRRWLGRRMSS